MRAVPGTFGLLMWTGQEALSGSAPDEDHLMMGINPDGFVHFQFNLGSGETTLVYNMSKVNDGAWHRVRATR